MTTYRLWLALRYTQTEHPLFQRIVITRSDKIPWFLWGIAILLSPLIMLPALIFSGLSASLIWMVNIGNQIKAEQQQGRYDLLSLLPIGEFGTNWLICTGIIHRNGAFERLHSPGLWGMRVLLIAFLVSTLTSRDGDWMVNTLAYAAAILALIIGHYQTVVAGMLVGLIATARIRDPLTLSLVAPGIMLALELATAFLSVTMGFVLLPLLIDTSQRWIAISLLFLTVLIFALIREVIVVLCWRVALKSLNTTPDEIYDTLSAGAHRVRPDGIIKALTEVE